MPGLRQGEVQAAWVPELRIWAAACRGRWGGVLREVWREAAVAALTRLRTPSRHGAGASNNRRPLPQGDHGRATRIAGNGEYAQVILREKRYDGPSVPTDGTASDRRTRRAQGRGCWCEHRP